MAGIGGGDAVITARGRAKVNLSLRVHRRDETGLHPLDSVVCTVDWLDVLTCESARGDELMVVGSAAAGVPSSRDNLVWTAVAAHRAATGISLPLSVRLDKAIPAAAGLGGGSADAAAALLMMDALHQLTLAPTLAASVGADVPYAVAGGWSNMAGYGEAITPISGPDLVVALVVPPIELATPAVYRRWDELGEPTGPAVTRWPVPPDLAAEGFVNDLYPAAIDLAPELADWRSDLERTWQQDVQMSGSGSALFSVFETIEEATAAVSVVSASARAAVAVPFASSGADLVEG